MWSLWVFVYTRYWGVSENPDWIPEHVREKTVNSFKHSDDARGDLESPTECSSFQNVNPFTRALAPPFIGRRRDFYIPKIPLSSTNIPNVNTYMTVFFIPYIYKPATSSHSKPGLSRTTTLTLLHTSSWISLFVTSEPDFRQILEFPVSWSSWLRRSEIPENRVFATPRLRRFEIPENRVFATPRLRRFENTENRMFATSSLRRFKIPRNRKCSAPEKHISGTSLDSTFRGWQVFLNSPTLAPRGSGLTPTIRFH
jgi:hypothetical protein